MASLVASRMLISSIRRLPTSAVAQITPGLSVSSLYNASRSLCWATCLSTRAGESQQKREVGRVL